jgi:hypothetical protein
MHCGCISEYQITVSTCDTILHCSSVSSFQGRCAQRARPPVQYNSTNATNLSRKWISVFRTRVRERWEQSGETDFDPSCNLLRICSVSSSLPCSLDSILGHWTASRVEVWSGPSAFSCPAERLSWVHGKDENTHPVHERSRVNKLGWGIILSQPIVFRSREGIVSCQGFPRLLILHRISPAVQASTVTAHDSDEAVADM